VPKGKVNTAEAQSLSIWEPEILRLTLFHEKEIIEQTWWEDLFGKKAENTQTKKLIHKEEDPFGKGKLILLSQPGRIDWQYIIDVEERINSDDPPPFTLGEFSVALDLFLKQMNKWFEFETCPSASRIAFGSVLLHRVESLQAGYRQLEPYLTKIKLEPENIREFMYRINRPRNSKFLSDLMLNRLSSWSVSSFIKNVLPLGTGSIQPFQSPECFACCLELDINTVPEYRAGFSKENLANVYQELVELGKEIAQKGDIQ